MRAFSIGVGCGWMKPIMGGWLICKNGAMAWLPRTANLRAFVEGNLKIMTPAMDVLR